MSKESVPVWKIDISVDGKPYATLNHAGNINNVLKRVMKSLTNDKYAKGDKRVADKSKTIDIYIRYVGERFEQF
jgi:hypothetical protein